MALLSNFGTADGESFSLMDSGDWLELVFDSGVLLAEHGD